ncbi:DUF295 domain-containing protein [Cephalotus follicularis]|uniref:DUF295 domain-containing protein n=1 Tax=Cephalotus follicularis TaxID=3775 RepID=A0A1Q3B629_CEPFO|nr:DUF295 domain-containing protein [Cephalotus follicularis]
MRDRHHIISRKIKYNNELIIIKNNHTQKSINQSILKFSVNKNHVSSSIFQQLKILTSKKSLFLGLTNPICLCVHDFPGLRPNFIYFADDDIYLLHYVDEGYSYGGHDLGIFNLKDIVLSRTIHLVKRIEPPPVWVIPNLNGSYAV